MRISVVFAALLITCTSLAAPLYGNTPLGRRDLGSASDLSEREPVEVFSIRAEETVYNTLEARINSKKKTANKAARKAARTAKKAEYRQAIAKEIPKKAKYEKVINQLKQAERRKKAAAVREKHNAVQEKHNSKAHFTGKRGKGNLKAKKEARGKAKNAVQQATAKAVARKETAKATQQVTAKAVAQTKRKYRKVIKGIAAKKQEFRDAAQRKHEMLKAAGERYSRTHGLPDKNWEYTVKAGGDKPRITKTGKDIRKGIFSSHVHANGKDQNRGFRNEPHQNTVGHLGTTRPLDDMVGPGREHTLTDKTTVEGKKQDHKKQPIRLITQQFQVPNTNGRTEYDYVFQGAVAHDQSRKSGPGKNDHFEVKPELPY